MNLLGLLLVALVDDVVADQARARLHELQNRLGLRSPGEEAGDLRSRIRYVQATWRARGRSAKDVEYLTQQLMLTIHTILGTWPAFEPDATPLIGRVLPGVRTILDSFVPLYAGWIDEVSAGSSMILNPSAAREVFDFLSATHPADATHWSWGDVVYHSQQWHALFVPHFPTRKRLATLGPPAVVQAWDDGWTLVRLTEPGHLVDESEAMGHCIGDSPVYRKRLVGTQPPYRYYSLRNPGGKPAVTIETVDLVEMDGSTSVLLLQVRGKANRLLRGKYQAQARRALEFLSPAYPQWGVDALAILSPDELVTMLRELPLEGRVSFLSAMGPDRGLGQVRWMQIWDDAKPPWPWVSMLHLSLGGDEHRIPGADQRMIVIRSKKHGRYDVAVLGLTLQVLGNPRDERFDVTLQMTRSGTIVSTGDEGEEDVPYDLAPPQDVRDENVRLEVDTESVWDLSEHPEALGALLRAGEKALLGYVSGTGEEALVESHASGHALAVEAAIVAEMDRLGIPQVTS